MVEVQVAPGPTVSGGAAASRSGREDYVFVAEKQPQKNRKWVDGVHSVSWRRDRANRWVSLSQSLPLARCSSRQVLGRRRSRPKSTWLPVLHLSVSEEVWASRERSTPKQILFIRRLKSDPDSVSWRSVSQLFDFFSFFWAGDIETRSETFQNSHAHIYRVFKPIRINVEVYVRDPRGGRAPQIWHTVVQIRNEFSPQQQQQQQHTPALK